MILVVDDDPAVLASVTDFLRFKSYTCLAAADGIQALGIMQQHTPDLIVSDIMMPKIDGYEFYQAVRENTAWALIPFIFLSAKGEQKDIRLGYRLGVEHYITKPFETEDMLIAIRSRLQRTAEMQAAARDGVEQMRQSFMQVVGHELRTPLTFIYGYLSLFEERKDQISEEVMDEYLQGMRKGTDRLIKLVEDLMLLATIDSGAAEKQITQYGQQVNLGVVVEEVIQMLIPQAEARNVSISQDVPYSLMIQGIPTYVRDVFKRLIDNAIKFSKPVGGRVWVRAESGGGQVRIVVQDTGIGIAPDYQAAIFERFRQIDRKTMEQQGLGLGLTIAHQLVQLHGGDVQVESQPGEGTTIIVSLPTVD
ncbi:MAG: hybrid sensor histidine kinase/response regulator [Anaerolineae bacterium]|nr:hybrid sensor histidine kinase/response regulator [Anaerolineae bacterium]